MKMGRPTKRTGERLSKNRTFRVRGALDENLREEIEALFERTFIEDQERGFDRKIESWRERAIDRLDEMCSIYAPLPNPIPEINREPVSWWKTG